MTNLAGNAWMKLNHGGQILTLLMVHVYVKCCQIHWHNFSHRNFQFSCIRMDLALHISASQTKQIIHYSMYLYGLPSAEHWCHAMAVKSLEHLEWIERQCLTQTTKKTTIVSDLLQTFQREEWKIFQRCISMSKSDFIHKLVSMVMMDKKVLTFFLTFLYLELILFIYCIIVLFSGD